LSLLVTKTGGGTRKKRELVGNRKKKTRLHFVQNCLHCLPAAGGSITETDKKLEIGVQEKNRIQSHGIPGGGGSEALERERQDGGKKSKDAAEIKNRMSSFAPQRSSLVGT